MAQPTPIRRDSPEFLSPAEPPARTARLSPLQIACGLSVGLFLLLKFPLLFAERHWEELRDLAALLEVAQGNLPHRDFYWHYGWLYPVVFGKLFQWLPANLLTVRALALGFEAVGVCLVTLTLARFTPHLGIRVAGTLGVTLLWGLPNYTHNHQLLSVGLALVAYGAVCWLQTERERYFRWAAAGAIGCLLCRPLLSGLGALGFVAVLAWFPNRAGSVRRLAILAAAVAAATALSFALLGERAGFMWAPRKLALYAPGGYPNLSFLIPRPESFTAAGLARGLGAALDTAVFYFAFFLWPGILVGRRLFSLEGHRGEARAAGALCALWLVAATDLLYYGYTNPAAEWRMLSRGQFTGFLFLISAFIPWAAGALRGRVWNVGLLGILMLWQGLGYARALRSVLVFPVNPSGQAELRGIVQNPRDRTLWEALAWANARCGPEVPGLVSFYYGGIHRLFSCRDILERDRPLLDGYPTARLSAGDSLYHTEGSTTLAGFLKQRVEQTRPVVIVAREGDWVSESFCNETDWEIRRFPGEPESYRVCWRANQGRLPGSASSPDLRR